MQIGIDYTAAARQRAGIGRYTRELIAALLAQDSPHQYVLLAAAGGLKSGDWEPEIGDGGSGTGGRKARLRPLPISDEWLARLWHRLRLPIPVEVLTGRIDVFYSPDFVLPPTRPRTRTLLTVHDLSFLHYPDHFVPKLVRYLSAVVPRSVARADRILADSEATRADLIARLGAPPDKVDVLYSGVDQRFTPEPEPGEGDRLRARYGLGDSAYILSVGTLQPRKNYLRLIRAFAALSAETEIDLVIAGGPGWLYEDVVSEATKLGDGVRILGFVEEAELPALYRNAAVFAFPSLHEGFGLPVLEAMACGVPVVCSGVSSLPEVAGDAALLVDPQDTDELAAVLRRALEDGDLRRDMVTSGLAQAARFTWERAARQLSAAFDTL
jgi:glycosyltransferase involved in cell wall biosynthesis